MDFHDTSLSENIGIDYRLEELGKAIEKLRVELHNTLDGSVPLSNNENTYCISNRLDRLIVQFLKVKQQVEIEKEQL